MLRSWRSECLYHSWIVLRHLWWYGWRWLSAPGPLWSSRGFLQAWLLVASAVSMLSCIGGTIAEHAVGFVGQSHMGTWLCIVVGRCRCRSSLWEWVLSYTQPCVLVADAFYSMSWIQACDAGVFCDSGSSSLLYTQSCVLVVGVFFGMRWRQDCDVNVSVTHW